MRFQYETVNAGQLLVTTPCSFLYQLSQSATHTVPSALGSADSANAGSVGVHRACGFEPVGVLKSAGWKFGRWLDVVMMQRSLGEGGRTEPVDL